MQKNFLGLGHTYRSIIVLCFFILFALFPSDLLAQLLNIKPKGPVVCYEAAHGAPDFIEPPQNFKQWKKNSSQRLKTATFEVEYVGFPADNLAKNAFQYAIDIWETQITSSVTIRVQAQWQPLGAGVLGQAIWGSAIANFDGAQHLNTYYPVALAEKIAIRDLNDPNDPDILASFNSNANWYLGTNGVVPAGKMDLVTVVLHEIAHGLGFTDTYVGENSNGSVGLDNGGGAIPFIYDLFIDNSSSQNLFTDFLSPSTQLKSQLTSNDLSFNSPLATSGLGVPPKIYAPNPFDPGSSIAHLDEATFSGAGNVNKLMTPQIAQMEVIHSPGPVVMGMLSDMGWVSTLVNHTPLKDTERTDGQPYIIDARIWDGSAMNEEKNLVLHYTTNGSTFTDVPMTLTIGGADELDYQASLPGVASETTYGYYMSFVDLLGRTITSPGKIQAQHTQAIQQLNVFNAGPDKEAPVIVHTPAEFVLEEDQSLVVVAQVTDNTKLSIVTLIYSVAGGSQGTIVMEKISPDSDEYTGTIAIPTSAKSGDAIKYRISAFDKAAVPNNRVEPASDYYTVYIAGIRSPQLLYVNSFDEPSHDFFGNSFKVETPNGFNNGAIHSHHPYADGTGTNNESHYIYQLQIPILLIETNPFIRFDEIVLVEPGEKNSNFGDSDFYDYVVVEGSTDNGLTWEPFDDGYDSRSSANWLTHYESEIANSNSVATGNPGLFVRRTINMLDNFRFDPGDFVLIRFRLYADPAGHGWGWAIDNLSIQGPVTGIEETQDGEFSILPNPAKQTITIKLSETDAPSGELQIVSVAGQVIRTEQIQNEGGALRKQIDISDLTEGVYIINIECNGKIKRKKLLKLRP
jgi:hypothetical protein